MHIMKKLLIILLACCLVPFATQAQDARQRTATTIIADALAQLPAETPDVYNTLMQELASTGASGISELAGMLVPAAQGANSHIEYALSGVAHFVTGEGHEAERAEVRKGLAAGIAACTDKPNQAFLLSLLQICSTAEDAEVFVKYANDEYLADAAIRGLISTPASEGTILQLMQETEKPTALLAYAASKRPSEGAEDILLSWLTDYQTDNTTKEAIYNALAACGGKASLKALADAAAASDYDFAPSDATSAYIHLINRMAEQGDVKGALAAARSLAKATARTNVRAAALEVMLKYDAKKRTQNLLAALNDSDRPYRGAALDYANDFADEALYAAVVKKMPSLGEEARTDIVNWLGAHHAASQIDVVVAMIGSNNGELAAAAIRAAGKIGGQTALDALIAQLGGPHAEEASQALRAFNGDATEGLLAALDGTPATQEQALKLVGLRRITKASDKVFDLLASNDTAVHDAAVDALAGVSTMADFERLCTLLDKASGTEVAKYQAALTNALSTQEPDVQYAKVSERMKSAPEQTRYYTLLAQSGSREAIDALLAAENREAAFDALLKVDNSEMIDVLYELATTNPAWTDNALSCYTDFVASHAAPEQRPALYEKGLQATPSAAVQNKLLRALANTYSFPSIATAAAYLDNPETAEAAAFAVKTIAAKHPGKGGDEVVKTLEKARDVYTALAKTDADAGYAVDEIKGLLTKYAEAPRFELSPEEAAEGYEVLFDGRSMEKWTGNTTNYVPLNGTIDVTAQYGGSGNLYTKKEYSDFILRFEFAFIRPGVNNGIGIRTPMGVDAAFDGMEIQVLDHDDPIYKNIKVYQQHGSVYGVIAAKRVKFGELGSWNTEEIRAVGDHITVTVNGEVILDGNIREACQGHNVAPDGSTKNPYTVDGRNHPGLFNKKGHIGLLGHGPGIQFRNIRIKEL